MHNRHSRWDCDYPVHPGTTIFWLSITLSDSFLLNHIYIIMSYHIHFLKIMSKKVIIIGSGFGGLSSAALLAKAGYEVTVLEKNKTPGGRAMQFSEKGFIFDMGPSWYMMPEVFERYFAHFSKTPSSFYKLVHLNPHYRIFFSKDDVLDMLPNKEKNFEAFEKIEPGSVEKITQYLEKSKELYEIAMKYFVYKNYDSVFDMFDMKFAGVATKMPVFSTMNSYISKYVTDDRLKKILLYTTVFIGGVPDNTPALYTLMSHIDFNVGVFYPMGGMFSIVQALVDLCNEQKVTIKLGTAVDKINVKAGKAVSVTACGKEYEADIILSNADMPHTEMALLDEQYQTYTKKYWEKKTIAPSAFILYLGVKGKIKNLQHHTLFFTYDWEKHFADMYRKPEWPDEPSMYICCPSKTDQSVAPKGDENLFVLVPIAPGLPDTPEIRTRYETKIIDILEETLGESIQDRLVVKKSLSINDYKSLYNAYQGTALGLAPNFFQTAFFRPNNFSKKVKNLYYVGQDTVPGVGVPMALISAELAVERVKNAE